MITERPRFSQMRNRGAIARALVAGVFLALELPLLLPLIAGAVAMGLVLRVQALAVVLCGSSRGGPVD